MSRHRERESSALDVNDLVIMNGKNAWRKHPKLIIEALQISSIKHRLERYMFCCIRAISRMSDYI